MRQLLIVGAVAVMGIGAGWWWISRKPPAKPGLSANSPPPAEARIVAFYAYPGSIARGDRSKLCYIVENAKSVRIEPAAPGRTPATNWCFQVSPLHDTEYRLKAETPDGRILSEKLVLRVRAPGEPAPTAPAGPRIEYFRADRSEVAPGATVTFCFAVIDAEEVNITPAIVPFDLPPRGCFAYAPKETGAYTLSARSSAGSATSSLVIRVR